MSAKYDIQYVFGTGPTTAGLFNFCIRRRIWYRIKYRNFCRHHIRFAKITLVLYDIACLYRMHDRYYSIPHDCMMSISTKTYANTVRCSIWYSLQVPGPAFAAGRTGHAPGAPRGMDHPASWSSALPDGLYYIVTVLTPFPSVWHVLLPMWVVTALYKQK